MTRIILFAAVLLCASFPTFAQVLTSGTEFKIDYNAPKEYKIGGIKVVGTKFLDKNVLTTISGLTVGDRITVPGDQITNSIKKLWKQKLFSNVIIKVDYVQDGLIFLIIELEERPRMSKYRFFGVKKKEIDDLRESVRLVKLQIVTENLIINTENTVRNYFKNEGFLNVEVDVATKEDTSKVNSVSIEITVKKNEKVKIKNINFHGVTEFKDGQLYRTLKETKRKRIWVFKSAKYINHEFEGD